MRNWNDADLENEESLNDKQVIEYLDSHPRLLVDYLDRNPQQLNDYVIAHVNEMAIADWLQAVRTESSDSGQIAEMLKIHTIDYLKEKNSKNKKHQTHKYIHSNLVVRRSTTWSLEVLFSNRPYAPSIDNVVLEFSIGTKPEVSNGTKMRCPMVETLKEEDWSCVLASEDNAAKKISVDVNIPADAIIGRYKVIVEITSELESEMKTERTTKPDIVVIFNPFSEDDECFMEDAASRYEYVLNSMGKLYLGNVDLIRSSNWFFGQFENGILDAALKLLREDYRAQKDPLKSLKKRSSPVYCSRVLSAMVNSNDDNGVVVGNWSGNYNGGKRPTFWSGSAAILKQWMYTNKPVKYGQCWVFSGVLTTVLRALGIPARSVSNFKSAHDTEYNMTMDKFVDENGDISTTRRTNDSIWNFHVWNEAWFKRNDLPKGYDGWQAVDATPQEESSGIMQLGPAPVKAVKSGEIYIGSDTSFVFGEVNADLAYWSVNKSGEVTGLIRRNRRYVGQKISTKGVGSSDREDITISYKHPEGSKEERLSFERAYAHGRRVEFHDKFDVIEEEGAINIDIRTVGGAINGKTILVRVKVGNATQFSRDVIITTVLNTMLNNDERRAVVKRVKLEVKIGAGETNQQDIELLFGEYGRQLVDENVIRVATTVRVKQTNNLYVDTYDITVESPPTLEIECDEVLKLDEANYVRFVITNPLPVSLTQGEILVEGEGVTPGLILKFRDPIPPGASYKTGAVKVTPYRSGITSLLADFDANEISNIKASKAVYVKQSSNL